MEKTDEKIFEALEFAAIAHKGQFRRLAKIPFIVHPLNVSKILAEYGFSDELLIAAILHDTVEDTKVSIEEIRSKFGERVAEIVENVTEIEESDPWEIRKSKQVESFENVNINSVLVAVADKLDNLRTIRESLERDGEKVWENFHGNKENQKKHYLRLLDVFKRRIDQKEGKEIVRSFEREVDEVFNS